MTDFLCKTIFEVYISYFSHYHAKYLTKDKIRDEKFTVT